MLDGSAGNFVEADEVVEGPRTTKKQAEAAAKEYARLLAARGGEGLTTEEIVEAAKDPASPFHPFFTWDVKEAARKRWLDEARSLIAKVRIIVTTRDGYSANVRGILNAKVQSRGREMKEVNVWIPRHRVLEKADTRAQVVARATEELRQWCFRYCDLRELDAVRRAIEKAIDLKLKKRK